MKKNSLLFGGILIAIILVIIASFIFYNNGHLKGYNEGYNKGYFDGGIAEGIKGCPGDGCINNSGCKTPFSYTLRSSCPFTSMCINDKCQVVCSWEMEETKCNKNADCNCSSFYLGKDIVNCSCINGFCAAIVTE